MMAKSQEKWLEAKTLYELGNSLSEITHATGIARSSISKKAKAQEWEHGKIQQLKYDKVNAINTLVEVDKKINTSVEPDQLDIINREVMTVASLRVKATTVQGNILDIIQMSVQQAARIIKNNPSGFHIKSQDFTRTTYGRNTEFVKDLAPTLNLTHQIIHAETTTDEEQQLRLNQEPLKIIYVRKGDDLSESSNVNTRESQ